MSTTLLHQLYGKAISTAATLLAVLLVYFLVNLYISKKISSTSQKEKTRKRSMYVAVIVFLFFLARIWVDGFTHLFTILGLVSAALVVTNKETIMNFVGWLIITWRELFVEEDLIQIQQYRGYVKSIGVLYFKIAESDDLNGNVTGRIIRIPNGLTANNPIINFSQTSHLLEQTLSITVKENINLESKMEFIKDLVNTVLMDFYKDNRKYSIAYLNKKHKHSLKHFQLEACVSLQPKPDDTSCIRIITHYYCFSNDAEKIQQKIWLTYYKSQQAFQNQVAENIQPIAN